MTNKTPAPNVCEDAKAAAQSLLVLIDLDRQAGLKALEKLCATARAWGLSVGNIEPPTSSND